jgi:hypothetical protein
VTRFTGTCRSTASRLLSSRKVPLHTQPALRSTITWCFELLIPSRRDRPIAATVTSSRLPRRAVCRSQLIPSLDRSRVLSLFLHGSTASSLRWQTSEQREAQEAQWAELRRTVDQMVSELEQGDASAARESATHACDIEYSLVGDCNATGRLIEALGLPRDQR